MKRKRRTGLMLLVYGLILLSLIGTIQLADRVSLSMNGGTQQPSAFSNWVEGMAYELPVWAYVVIFLTLVLAIRFGLDRYYRRQYDASLQKMTPHRAYTHIARYQEIDPGFSRDRFAEMVGRLQESLQNCSKDLDFSAARPHMTPALFESLPSKESGFDMDMLQLELCGFSNGQGKDTMSVLVTCMTRLGIRKSVFEWLFVRPSGETTPPYSSGDDILGYGGWRLESIKKVG